MKYLLFVLMPFLAFAQTHRFIYEMQYKKDSTKDFDKVNMALDINPDEVKFYNAQYIEIDSLNKTRPGTYSTMWDDETPVIVRKRNTDNNKSYLLLDGFFVIETSDKLKWTLTDETAEDSGYKLQKAATSFGGRNWIAWFTKDINLQEGPYKFRGLPGMIFKIEDDRNNYKFVLVKSYRLAKTYDTSNFLETFAGMKPLKITQAKYNKLLLDNYSDPLHSFRESYSRNTNPENKFFFNSIEIKDISQFKELTEIKKKMIRENNNLIELLTAVRYPEQ